MDLFKGATGGVDNDYGACLLVPTERKDGNTQRMFDQSPSNETGSHSIFQTKLTLSSDWPQRNPALGIFSQE